MDHILYNLTLEGTLGEDSQLDEDSKYLCRASIISTLGSPLNRKELEWTN